MMDSFMMHDRITTFLRRELAQEAGDGFPRLKRVSQCGLAPVYLSVGDRVNLEVYLTGVRFAPVDVCTRSPIRSPCAATFR